MTTAVRTDAKPVSDHIRRLHASGLTDRRIATIAGLAPETVSSFTKPINRPGTRRSVKRTCHPAVAAAILAINPADQIPGFVDAVGARRRVQALVARGWPLEHIARRVGISGNHMRLIIAQPRLYGRTAHAIVRVYDELRSLQPTRHGVAPAQVKRARDRAGREGWPTVAYWADRMDVIDDPDFEPMYGITRREIIAQDANLIMRTTGVDKTAAAERLGVSRSYIEHAFRDHPQYAVEVAA